MLRLIHTSDWQLGLKLASVPDGRRSRVQNYRFQVIEEIAKLARQRHADAVLVAGDVFDDNAVGREILSQAKDAIALFGDIPVLLIPGNHDPSTPDAALARLEKIPSVHVLSKNEPLEIIDGVVFYPCPLTSRNPREDPTGWIPADGPDDKIRVVLAHGSAIDFSAGTDGVRLLDIKRLLDKGMDYVALGDWHGTLRLDDRVWYSGAPEATRFKESDPGNVLVVELDSPGAVPKVESVRVASTTWVKRRTDLTEPEDLDALETWLSSLPVRSKTLVELRLSGSLSYAELNRLDRLVEQEAEELLWLRMRMNTVTARPSAEDLQQLDTAGFVGRAADALREVADPGESGLEDASEADLEDDGREGDLEEVDDGELVLNPDDLQDPPAQQRAQDALQLLYRFMSEAGGDL